MHCGTAHGVYPYLLLAPVVRTQTMMHACETHSISSFAMTTRYLFHITTTLAQSVHAIIYSVVPHNRMLQPAYYEQYEQTEMHRICIPLSPVCHVS
jgi:hypothetical protein